MDCRRMKVPMVEYMAMTTSELSLLTSLKFG